jgi:carbamoyltransferase
VSGEGFRTPGVYGALAEVRRLAAVAGREGVAAEAQAVLEEVLVAYVTGHLAATGERALTLAGGVFANVRLNQKLHRIPGIERVFVFPHMGDGGLGYGAAVDLMAELQGRKSQAIGDVYWGPAYDDGDLESALLRSGVDYLHVPDIEARVSRLLLAGKVVGRFAGRMEFGPRALGNRSILCAAAEKGINASLNRRLQRTEFMPFAPVVRAADAPALFPDLAGAERAAEYMTMTFDCGPEMAEAAPAVVHVDGTARPQVLRPAVNPSYHEILDRYCRQSGRPALVNTSFNIHEEPIVMTPEDAIRAYVASGIDALALGPFLSERRS